MTRTQVRLFRRPDGAISMVSPSWTDALRTEPDDTKFYQRAVMQGIPADWILLGDVDKATLDIRHQEGWTWDGTQVVVDLQRYQAIVDQLPGSRLKVQIANAASIADLKAVLTTIVGG